MPGPYRMHLYTCIYIIHIHILDYISLYFIYERDARSIYISDRYIMHVSLDFESLGHIPGMITNSPSFTGFDLTFQGKPGTKALLQWC